VTFVQAKLAELEAGEDARAQQRAAFREAKRQAHLGASSSSAAAAAAAALPAPGVVDLPTPPQAVAAASDGRSTEEELKDAVSSEMVGLTEAPL
jgi:hypothetical protein